MIGRLRGELIQKAPPYLLVDVQGVGYEVLAPMSTFYQLPETGKVTLVTHLSISENAHQLFGFSSESERELFRQLIKVSGVGPKMALAMLSGMEPADIAHAISDNNVTALTRIPGVGKKTAERLVIEMRDRLKDWQEIFGGSVSSAPAANTSVKLASGIVSEAESAMIALGYKPVEASKAINRVLKEHEVSRSEDLIRLALRSMLPA